MYYVDVYTDKNEKWMGKYHFVSRSNQYGTYYHASMKNIQERNKLVQLLKKKHIRYRVYDSRQERSSTYRDEFFLYNIPPYRCRYCHKKIDRKELQVDHIIPVSRVKTSVLARNLMYLQGFDNVNDVKNLAASCRTCNLKKGTKMGLWYVRGILGKYRVYWVVRKIFIIVCVLLAICQLHLLAR